MSRDQDSLKIEKWAATGNVADPSTEGIDRAEGWGIEYAMPGGKVPAREVWNQWMRELTALGDEVNRHGCGLPWDATISYLHPALVTGADGKFYLSVADSTNVDPVNDTARTSWRLAVEANVRNIFVGTDANPPSEWVDGDIYFQRET